ncbi:urease accessory protein UreD [Paenibacillus sp. SN-8-1]|uniref:urease accessory protein UreD n=1 Tax=Paenibacillus sp. SN-8-1 TaxID=3435409 RepID=UPI003D9A5B26
MGNLTGTLRLSLENRDMQTVMRESYASGAFKISPPTHIDESGQKLLYLMNPGGGYVDGDQYAMDVTLDAGAELILTTQSATKVYRTPTGSVCSDTKVKLAGGALLEMLPDPIIAYEDARYFQKTVFHLEEGAHLIAADSWTPGWSPSGDHFRYRRIDSLTELYMGGRLQMVDRFCLEPADEQFGFGEMEGYTHYGSLLVVHEQATPEAVELLYEQLEESFSEGCPRFGLTVLAVPGFVMRVMAYSTEEIQQLMEACHDRVRQEWLCKPVLRIRK